MKRLAYALALLATAATAQDVEQVTVYGGNLSGFWQVEGPSWMQMTLMGHVTWGPMRQGFCRIDRDAEGYVTHCFRQKGQGGTLAVDGTHFHLAWGSMLARLVYDGEVTSATRFDGHFAAKLMGIALTDPDLSQGRKIAPKTDAPDDAGKVAVLRALLAGETVAHDPALDDSIAAARDLKLGKLESISFLGRQMQAGTEGPKKVGDPTYLAAYAVEFAAGETLCWLHQDDDGKIAAFQCS